MATKFKAIFDALQAPFPANEIKRKPSGGGKMLDYITARSAMKRLDEVVGPENWRDSYRPIPNGAICRIEVRLPDGEWLTHEDAGGEESMVGAGGKPDVDNSIKSSYSNAFRRAGAKFGIGRYLYKDGVPVLIDEDDDNQTLPIAAGGAPPTNGNGYYPPAPAPAPPPSNGYHPAPAPAPAANGYGYGAEIPQSAPAPAANDPNRYGDMPRGPKGLYRWAMGLAESGIVAKSDILGKIDAFGKRHGLPARSVEWVDQAAIDCAAEIVAWLDSRSTGAPAPAANGYHPAPAASAPAATPADAPAARFGAGPIPGENLIDVPRDGRHLFQLVKEAEKALPGVSFLTPVNGAAKARGVNGRMTEWAPDAIRAAWRDLCALLATYRESGQLPAHREIRVGGHPAPEFDAVKVRAKITAKIAERLHFSHGTMPNDADIEQWLEMTLADMAPGRSMADLATDVGLARDVLQAVTEELETAKVVTGHAPAY